MTIVEFARVTGWSEAYIRRKVNSGEIPHTMGKISPLSERLSPMISETLVSRFKKPEPGPYNKHFILGRAKAYSKPEGVKSLGEVMHQLYLYNQEHGTDYTYGQAIQKGIIK